MERARSALRVLLAIAMIGVGIMHFTHTVFFERIIPEWLPAHRALALVSGAAEILLGVTIVPPQTRKLASYGLVALYVAVFPANINMLVHHDTLAPDMPVWGLAARLPMQVVFIAWALWVGRDGHLPLSNRDAPSTSPQ